MDKPCKPRRGKITGWDIVIVAVVLLIAGGWLTAQAVSRSRAEGETAVITTPEGEQTVSLRQEKTLYFTGKNHIHVEIRIENGSIWFAHSECHDHLCMKMGKLSRPGQMAACLPAGIMVRITGQDSGIDAEAY